MIGLIPGKYLMTSRVHSRQFDGIFNRSSATECKECLIEIARTKLREFFSQLSTNFCYAGRRYVGYFLHLFHHGFGYALVAMPDVYIHQSRRKIDITFALIIIE